MNEEKEKIFDKLHELLQGCDIDADDVICSKIVLDDTYECTVAPSGDLYYDECRKRCNAIAVLLRVIQKWKEGCAV